LPTAEESLDRSLLLAVAAVDEADGNPPNDARTSLLSSLLFWPAFVMPLPDGDAGAVGTPAVTAPGDGSALSGAITVDRQGRYVAAGNANGGVDVVELSSWPVSVGMTDVPDSYRLPIDGS